MSVQIAKLVHLIKSDAFKIVSRERMDPLSRKSNFGARERRLQVKCALRQVSQLK